MIWSKNQSHATVPLKRVGLSCSEAVLLYDQPSSLKCGNFTFFLLRLTAWALPKDFDYVLELL